MEVIAQDVKPEVDPVLDENSPGEELKFNINTSNNNSSGGRVLSHPKSVQQQQQNLVNNNPSSAGIQYISTTGGSGGGIVTPVRTTTILSGQQIQTMAKSTGLSIVHVTIPQVENKLFWNHDKKLKKN